MTNYNFLLTLNTAYIGFLVTLNQKKFVLFIFGISLCIIWMLMNKNYKERNKIKFEIINEYEKKYNQFYLKEFKRKKNKKMFNLSCLENIIIFIFILFYVVLWLFY